MRYLPVLPRTASGLRGLKRWGGYTPDKLRTLFAYLSAVSADVYEMIAKCDTFEAAAS